MMRLPEKVASYLLDYSLKDRRPAYLVVGKKERLEDFSRDCSLYGIGPLDRELPFSIKYLSSMDCFP